MSPRPRPALVLAALATLAVILALTPLIALAQTASTATFRRRVALVVGNARYDDQPELPNARSDAEAVARALNRMGFDAVHLALNADRANLASQLGRFTSAVGEGDLALLFYAGHGQSYRETNYLIPVDFRYRGAGALSEQGFSIDELLARLQARGSTNVLIVDACRENPWGRRLVTRRMRGQRADTGRGLSLMRTSAGSLIVFSTAPGDIAADTARGATGRDLPNSPFTAALLEHLEEPRDIDAILRDVRRRVMALTALMDHPQVP